MNVKTRNAVIAIVLVAALVLSATAFVLYESMKGDNNTPAAITDGIGRTVKLDQQPSKIISTSDTTTAMIFALGLGSRVIGVNGDGNYNVPDTVIGLTTTGDFPKVVREELAKEKEGKSSTIKSVGDTWGQNVETLASMGPDLVVLDYNSYTYSGIKDRLSDFGIEYIVTGEEMDLDDILDNVKLLGQALGRSATAEKVIDEMKEVMSSINNKVKSATTEPKVAFLFMAAEPYYAIASGTFMHSQIELAGGQNAFGALSGWAETAKEGVLSVNPDIIIVDMDMGIGSSPDYGAMWASMQADPIWSQINAVKNGDVYFLTGSARAVTENASLRIVEGAALMAMILHPELYEEDLPQIIGDEYQEYLD
ncbi:ABC transporter substrate-binding protein [Methanomassiliicoccus luminyensis]|uniref:ABC transporter substrate-binding protein n=1 Tax=Methanomassiliicoccus luminyensis TaxID=1080712 RepID=UPI00138B0902|nr:ABC transporter substrate-binding protein [Methanomassiliicoccus luminyensis]